MSKYDDFRTGLPVALVEHFLPDMIDNVWAQADRWSASDVMFATGGRWRKGDLAEFLAKRVDFVPAVMEKLFQGSGFERRMYYEILTFTNLYVTFFWRKELNDVPDHVMNQFGEETLSWSNSLFVAFKEKLELKVTNSDWYASRLREFRVEGRKIVALKQVNDA